MTTPLLLVSNINFRCPEGSSSIWLSHRLTLTEKCESLCWHLETENIRPGTFRKLILMASNPIIKRERGGGVESMVL